jgi:peptidoglycan/LPS O-acetylase OafA/YrhL
MFGIFRYVLAIAVTLSHLWYEFAGWAAVAAVFGFFAVSGYLITSILQFSYGFTTQGLARYATNRVLRLFPTYWFVLLLSILVIWLFPREAFQTNFKLSMPVTAADWRANLAIVGLLHGPVKVLIPPAWTLDIEIFFYVAMAAGLCYSRVTVAAWFAASLLFTVLLWVTSAEFSARYAAYSAASLPFSMGAMICMYRREAERWICLPVLPAAGLLLCAAIIARKAWLDPLGAGFYLQLVACCVLLVALSCSKVSMIPKWLSDLDRFAGNLAYPIFLCHWQVAVVVLAVVHAGARPPPGELWLQSILIMHLVATLVYLLVDRNVNRLRDAIRGSDRIDARHPVVQPCSATTERPVYVK